MPILTPPPSDDEDDGSILGVKPAQHYTWEEYRRVQLFLSVNPWKCKCGLTMHGRVLQCVRENCRQPRPADYKKHG
jgi:hypothetical protein